jgi:hypothetical protein
MAVIAVEPILGADPEKALTVLDEAAYRGLGEALVDAQLLEPESLLLTLQTLSGKQRHQYR